MRQTQGKVEASKDTVKELNKRLEPVEVTMALDNVPICLILMEVSLLLACRVCHEGDCFLSKCTHKK